MVNLFVKVVFFLSYSSGRFFFVNGQTACHRYEPEEVVTKSSHYIQVANTSCREVVCGQKGNSIFPKQLVAKSK